jgi:hypothetical protein
MPAYDSIRGQLVRLQAELFNILERMVVAQRRTNFLAPWWVYFHDCLVSRTLSGCVWRLSCSTTRSKAALEFTLTGTSQKQKYSIRYSTGS